jgi:hypothetical protein
MRGTHLIAKGKVLSRQTIIVFGILGIEYILKAKKIQDEIYEELYSSKCMKTCSYKGLQITPKTHPPSLAKPRAFRSDRNLTDQCDDNSRSIHNIFV